MEDIDEVKQGILDQIEEIMAADVQGAIRKLREFLKGSSSTEELDIYQERAIYELMRAYSIIQDADALIGMLKELRSKFDTFSKSKRENIVKRIFEKLALIPNTDEKQIAVCEEYIQYFQTEKRHFLRQRFEAKLAALLTKTGDYQRSIQLLHSLSSEVKKLDDKLMLVEIYLIESRAYYALNNIAKSRSSLTAARTNSNAVFVGVTLQAEIDLQSGVINAHEHDYRTAYSYFFEAHEGFISKGDKVNALTCLKYMLLSKIMNNQTNEINSILNFKNSLEFVSEIEIVALKKINDAVKERSLELFSQLLAEYGTIIEQDSLIKLHLNELKSSLLEKNLCRIIEPYSRVQVERIAELIKLPEDDVMTKLSQMILDKKFKGILDQGSAELIVYDAPVADTTYQDSLQLLSNMGNVVNNLIRRARHLQAQ